MSEIDHSDSERLRRLEEHLSFAEHTIEQLSQVVREASDAQRALERRITLLERRLATAELAAESAATNADGRSTPSSLPPSSGPSLDQQ